MDRENYNSCLRPYITGSKPKEQRKMDFCIGAKICSGKTKDEEEAKRLCSLPKEIKELKTKRSRKSAINTVTLATCVIKTLDGAEVTINNLEPIIASCMGQKAGPTTREKFIKKCFKENTSGNGFQYDIKEAQKLRSFCIAKWKEQEVAA